MGKCSAQNLLSSAPLCQEAEEAFAECTELFICEINSKVVQSILCCSSESIMKQKTGDLAENKHINYILN